MKNQLINLICCIVVVSCTASRQVGLKIENKGTEKAYFSKNGKPLLSFGGGAGDGMFWLNEDAFDYKKWADWEYKFGMNHSRDYPPLTWMGIEKLTKENGGELANCLFPYELTKKNNRKFDLTKFDETYWKQFREKLEYLQKRGIVVHLLMWNGWNTNPHYPKELKFDSHFFNPNTNVNEFTKDLDWKSLYYSVADGNKQLVEAQKAWFNKLIEQSYDLDNVYYDLVHEMGDLVTRGLDWEKAKLWVEEMAKTVRKSWKKLNPDREIILGMDGGVEHENRNFDRFSSWLYTREYFDVVIWGKNHSRGKAVKFRKKYKKPYIGQESWDDNGQKYRYREARQAVAMRKYYWKFMMCKCQQMDMYHKPLAKNFEGFPINYDPNGHSKFEDYAKNLRIFWNSIVDYPKLWFEGKITGSKAKHKFVLSSGKEAIAYLSSGTGEQNVKYRVQNIEIKKMGLNDGFYNQIIYYPETGKEIQSEVEVKGGKLVCELPKFVDDIVVHLVRK
jgi:hypothetical protein